MARRNCASGTPTIAVVVAGAKGLATTTTLGVATTMRLKAISGTATVEVVSRSPTLTGRARASLAGGTAPTVVERPARCAV